MNWTTAFKHGSKPKSKKELENRFDELLKEYEELLNGNRKLLDKCIEELNEVNYMLEVKNFTR